MIVDGKTFGERKQQVSQWLKAPQQKDSRGVEEPLDDNIADTIRALNEKLSFLYTTGSCGGHFRSRDDIRKEYPDATDNQLILPNEGYVLGLGGDITFVVDENTRSEKFISEIEKVIAQYPGAKLYKGRDGYYNLHLVRHLYDGDAFTEEETVVVRKQIQALLVEIQNLVALSESIVLRRWMPGDAPSVEDLKDLNVLLQELKAPDDPEPNLTRESFVEHMRFTNATLIIARDAETKRIVGMTSLHVKHLMGIGLIGEVEEVVLKEEYRRRGIAEALEDELLRAAHERGVKFLSLTSAPWRIAANKFYKRRGWTTYATNNYWRTLE